MLPAATTAPTQTSVPSGCVRTTTLGGRHLMNRSFCAGVREGLRLIRSRCRPCVSEGASSKATVGAASPRIAERHRRSRGPEGSSPALIDASGWHQRQLCSSSEKMRAAAAPQIGTRRKPFSETSEAWNLDPPRVHLHATTPLNAADSQLSDRPIHTSGIVSRRGEGYPHSPSQPAGFMGVANTVRSQCQPRNKRSQGRRARKGGVRWSLIGPESAASWSRTPPP